MSDFYEPQGDIGVNARPDVSGPGYPCSRSIPLVPQAALTLMLVAQLSSPSAHPEEQWAAMFPQS